MYHIYVYICIIESSTASVSFCIRFNDHTGPEKLVDLFTPLFTESHVSGLL